MLDGLYKYVYNQWNEKWELRTVDLIGFYAVLLHSCRLFHTKTFSIKMYTHLLHLKITEK